jgi:hypothetical protein
LLRSSRGYIETPGFATWVFTEVVVPVLTYSDTVITVWNEELTLDGVPLVVDGDFLGLEGCTISVVATPGVIPGVGVSDDGTNDKGDEKNDKEKVSH